MHKINPCLWFDSQAEEAAKFYSLAFKNTKITKVTHYGASAAEVSGQKKGSVLTVEFELENQKIVGLNGGPRFKFTPALSFFVWCETEKEIESLWKSLSKGGNTRMGLDKYPWAEKYGWTTDKFGVEWQMMLTPHPQKVVPAFLFVDGLFGKGEEALNFYLSQFEHSKIDFMNRDEATKSIRHCQFTLANQSFVLMEGPGNHGYTFSLAFSLMVNCKTQAEIDRYWTNLSRDGEASQCGWLTDKYGVSWQIVPEEMGMWMNDPEKSEKVMKAMLQMTKLDVEKLKKAYES